MWIHPLDAAAAGIENLDLVEICNAHGTIVGRALVTDHLTAGAVSIPHGLGQQNVSVLTNASPGFVDPLTGMVTQSGIPITIRKAPDHVT